MKIFVFIFFLMMLPLLLPAQDDHNHSPLGQEQGLDPDTITTNIATENTRQDPALGSEDSFREVKAALDDFPNLHPLVVHFPIVLLLLGAFLQLIQIFTLKRNLDWIILLTVGGGFIGAYIAGVYAHPHTQDLTEMAKKVLEQHDKFAEWTIYSSAVAATLKLISLFLLKKNRVFEIFVFLILAFSAYSVAEAGHYGSQLVYIEGVGPQGEYLETEKTDGNSKGEGHSH
jgi:uncharacterized membrane protein